MRSAHVQGEILHTPRTLAKQLGITERSLNRLVRQLRLSRPPRGGHLSATAQCILQEYWEAVHELRLLNKDKYITEVLGRKDGLNLYVQRVYRMTLEEYKQTIKGKTHEHP
ncbi:hypothetical protein [Leptolyngbya sp. FACHB-261]|uniref:hypothetical protein n=1 Tax=Leptolyngbya sp. FACHB-261 TaxID=2692806 RepID=UPI0016876A1A|nr:hypothetical protein [Leptolyngbya sp. FACHB-261]MBD2105180.1 hypothetical protein [Leptolyngbya sp. FACHB-261]